MWHIFEKRIVQGYQKLYFHTIQTWTSEFRTVVRSLVSILHLPPTFIFRHPHGKSQPVQKRTISKISQPRPPLKSIWRDAKNPANCNANFYLSTLLRGKTEALQTSYQQNQLTKARTPFNFWCSKNIHRLYVHWVCETSISETRLIAYSSRVAFPLIGFSDLAVLVAADGRHLMQNWYEKTFRRLDFEITPLGKKIRFPEAVNCTYCA